MGKTIECKIKQWNGGMTNLLRGVNPQYARLVKNFDIISDPTRMIPNPDMATELFDAGLDDSTEKLCKFLPANVATNDGTVQYALGISSTAPKIFAKSSAITEWASLGVSTGDGVRNENLFIEYQGRIYFANATMVQSYSISANTYDTAGGGTLSKTLNHTNIFQGLVHSKDNVLYIPYYTTSSGVTSAFIASKNGSGAFNATALTLPLNMIPIMIKEYGNFVAIALRPANIQSKKSVVYLWDRDSLLTTITESIDWGLEKLELIEEIDGIIVGVSSFANTSSEIITVRSKLIFKYWTSGSRAKQFLEIPLSSASINNNSTLAWDNQKINNRIFFMASVEIQSTRYDAIWAIARKDDGSLTVSIDRLLNNDTAITSCIPKGFYKFGDYFVVAYTNNGAYVVNVTVNGAETYTTTSIYETIIMGESFLKNQLKSAGVMFEKLLAGGEVKLKCRIDGATAWTEIFHETTDGLLFREAINFSDGTNLPEFREIEFQITSIGGAVITGFWAQAEEIDKGLVSRILKVISGWLG